MSDVEFVIKKGVLKEYKGAGGNITIPKEVKTVGENVFNGNKTITSVTFAEGVEEIESSAFEDCKALKRVYIPKTLTRFNSAAFMNSGVKEVYITDLAAWCDSYFSYATANPLGCGADLYLNGELVTDLVIPDGVDSISGSAFERCRSIRSVTIPDSVEKIWDSFEGCKNLEVIRFGNGLRFVAGAFKYCENIKEVYIDSIEAWCNILFNGWGDETPLHSGAILYIGGEPAIDIYIPDGIEKISGGAFYGYKWLKSISFPGRIDIGYQAFEDCSRLQIMEFRDDGNFDTDAFNGCSALLVIKIPAMKTLLWNVLREHTEAKYIGADDVLKEQDGFRYAELREGTYLYRYDKKEENLVLPERLNGKTYEIADFAFYNCDFIKSLTIPEGAITKIGTAAFSGCKGLTELTVPQGMKFSNSVFSRCESLESVELNSAPASFMFEDCTSLSRILIGEGVPYVDQYTFKGCRALKEITIPAAAEYVGNGAFQDCPALERVVFANTEGWRRKDEYTSYDYGRRGGEPFDVSSPEENAKNILKDGNDWYYFKLPGD